MLPKTTPKEVHIKCVMELFTVIYSPKMFLKYPIIMQHAYNAALGATEFKEALV
jgi:hypothetical protein